MPRVGRAASSIRPGLILRDVLAGRQPVILMGGETTGELVHAACATDIHRTYQELLRRENALRPKHAQLRGMTSESFAKIVRFARLLGLVEVVKEEETRIPPPPFYRVEMDNRQPYVAPGTRKMLKLTQDGMLEGLAWMDLRRAWSEGWPIPQVGEELPPPPSKAPPPTEAVKPARPWKPFKVTPRPSARQFNLLIHHLTNLSKVGISAHGVDQEVEKLYIMVADWQVELDDMIEIADPVTRRKYVVWHKEMTPLLEALEERDLDAALVVLRRLVT